MMSLDPHYEEEGGPEISSSALYVRDDDMTVKMQTLKSAEECQFFTINTSFDGRTLKGVFLLLITIFLTASCGVLCEHEYPIIGSPTRYSGVSSFDCRPLPEDPASLKEPFYTLCLDFNEKVPGFSPPYYSLVGSKGSKTCKDQNSTSCVGINSIYPALSYSLKFVIPRDVKELTVAGLFDITNGSKPTVGTSTPHDKILDNGVQHAEAFKCAITNINRNKTLLPHTRLNYQVWDTNLSPQFALNAAYLAMQSNATSIIGLDELDDFLALAPLTYASNLTQISGEASSAFLADPTRFPTLYRTVPADLFAARTLVEMFRLFQWNQVAAIFANDTLGSSGEVALDLSIQTSIERGFDIHVICRATLDVETIVNFDSYFGFLNCIRTTKVKAIIIWTSPPDAATALRLISQAGPDVYTPETVFIATFEWADVDTFDTFNDMAEDALPKDILEGSFAILPRTFSDQAILDCYAQLTPSNTNYPAFLLFWELNFRCSLYNSSYFTQEEQRNLTFIAHDKDLPVCTAPYDKRDPLSDDGEWSCTCPDGEFLDSLSVDPYADYIYDAVYAVAYAYDKLLRSCEQAGSQPCDLPYFDNDLLFEAVDSTDFVGLTGRVSWNGHSRKGSDITIYQFTSQATKRVVGESNDTGVYIFKDRLSFKVPVMPMSVIVPQVITFSTTVGIIVGSIFLFIIGVCVASMAALWMFRKSEPVYSSGLSFLLCFLCGCAVCALSGVLWTLEQTTFVCIFKLIILALGSSMVLGALMAKTYRSFEVLCLLKVPSDGIDLFTICTFPSALFAMNFILLLLLFLISGSFGPVIKQSQPSSLFFYVSCTCNDSEDSSASSPYQMTMTIIILVLNFLLSLVTTGLSLATLSLESPHNEATCVAVVLIDLTVVFLVLSFVYLSSNDITGNIQSKYIIRSVGTIYILVFSIGFMILPKLLVIWKGKGRGSAMSEDSDSDDYFYLTSTNMTTANTMNVDGDTNTDYMYSPTVLEVSSLSTRSASVTGAGLSSPGSYDSSSPAVFPESSGLHLSTSSGPSL